VLRRLVLARSIAVEVAHRRAGTGSKSGEGSGTTQARRNEARERTRRIAQASGRRAPRCRTARHGDDSAERTAIETADLVVAVPRRTFGRPKDRRPSRRNARVGTVPANVVRAKPGPQVVARVAGVRMAGVTRRN